METSLPENTQKVSEEHDIYQRSKYSYEASQAEPTIQEDQSDESQSKQDEQVEKNDVGDNDS
jgi:hypothetical protein